MIMGTSKWGDAGDAYDAILGDAVEDDFFIGVMRDYGNRTEPLARVRASELIGANGFPIVGYRGDYLASLDFFTSKDGRRIGVEVKCPYQREKSATWKAAQKNIIEPGYADQMTHQAKVFALDEVYLFVYIDDSTNKLLRFMPDEGRWEQITKAWDDFISDHVNAFERPNTYKKRDDEQWKAAAEAFVAARAERVKRAAEEERAKEALLKLANGVKCEGAGVRVNFFPTRGTIDYKLIVNDYRDIIISVDSNFSEEVYRQSPRNSESVTIIKPPKADGEVK
jgi:hypothetical protein